MNRNDLIAASDFCTGHQVSYTFVSRMEEAGLIEVVHIEDHDYLHPDQLGELEKLVRMYTELDINIEGIEAIAHLLQQVNDMQQQLTKLRQKLHLYEHNESSTA